MNKKCSHVVRRIRRHILFLHKEVRCVIPKRRCTKLSGIGDKNDKGLLSQEKWGKKVTEKATYFKGNALKDALKNMEVTNCKATEPCLYCDEKELSVSADWVACDLCNNWVHQNCVSNSSQISFTGDFICKLCLSKQISLSDGDIATEGNNATSDYGVLTSKQLKNVEKKTRAQRNCALWREEHELPLPISEQFARPKQMEP